MSDQLKSETCDTIQDNEPISQLGTSRQQGEPRHQPGTSRQQVKPKSQPRTSSQQVKPKSQSRTFSQQSEPNSRTGTSRQQVKPKSQRRTSSQQYEPTSLPGTSSQQAEAGPQPGTSSQQDEPRHQQRTSSQQAEPKHQPGTSSQQIETEPQPGTSRQQDEPRHQPGTSSQQFEPTSQPGTSSQQTETEPQPGTSSQQFEPTSQPGTSRQQAGTGPQPGTSSQQSEPRPQQGTSSQQAGSSGSQPPKNPKWKLCPFNLDGTCRHGDKCWYSHAHRSIMTNTDSSVTRHSSTLCPRHQILLPNPPSSSSPSMDPSKWVQAPEFIPQEWKEFVEEIKVTSSDPCPALVVDGVCFLSASACPCLHGDRCELCDLPCLDPNDEAQRKAHIAQCTKELEKNMEESFAIQRSESKVCGICREVVWDKENPSERQFGILENCNHVYCYQCIRTWRQTHRPEEVQPPMPTRQCPECRVHSNFFIRSSYWVDGEAGKQRAIRDFKDAVAQKPCKYFKVGSFCPLADLCFYLHSDSIRAQMLLNPPPPPRRRRTQPETLDPVEQVEMFQMYADDDPGDLGGDL